MITLFYTLLSLLLVSSVSLVGLFTLTWAKSRIHDFLHALVALAAGTMMGTAFLHLLPEAAEHTDAHQLFVGVLLSFVSFFIIEKFLHWRHCHEENCATHTFGYMNLIGDGFHNFLDGIIIAAAYATSVEVGIAATLAVLIHEIPQEIGDFGVLVKAGYTVQRALFLNFLTALAAIAGGIVGFLLLAYSETFIYVLTPFAAGSFLYIAATDLLPQLQTERVIKKSVASLLIFLLGIGITYLLQVVFHAEAH
jgi:zinc and cadmium transporter